MIEVVPQKSSLADLLRGRIRREGPITFRDWMQAALYHPQEGYYRRDKHKIWGRGGDYRTSTERSELFAATFARYFAAAYEHLGNPDVFTIAEVGGGEGQFASGVLGTLRAFFPMAFSATHYIFDEIGETARTKARQRLTDFGNRVQFVRLDEVKIDSGVVFSNELIDAFPVHRATVIDGELCEYYVDVSNEGDFVWTTGPASTASLISYLNQQNIQLSEGQTAEINLEVEMWLARVAQALKRGYVITVDYGAEAPDLYSPERFAGTLRSFHNHTFVENLLASPGGHDVTSTINWTAMRSAGDRVGLKTVQFESQDKFLIQQGLLEQLQLRSEELDNAGKLRLSTTAREMILPDGMAASFQVLVQEKSVAV